MAHDPHEHHAHDHGHDHASAPHAHASRAAVPGLSLLRMSVPQRLLGAAALIGLLWLGVLWALN